MSCALNFYFLPCLVPFWYIQIGCYIIHITTLLMLIESGTLKCIQSRMRYRWSDSTSSSLSDDNHQRRRRKPARDSNNMDPEVPTSTGEPPRPFCCKVGRFLLLFAQGILTPFLALLFAMGAFATWAVAPDEEENRRVSYAALDTSWKHFGNDDFMGRGARDELFGHLREHTDAGQGVMEIRDLGDGLTVVTRMSDAAHGDYISGFSQSIFFLCVDLFVWPVLLNELGLMWEGERGPMYQGPLFYYAFLASLLFTWTMLSMFQVAVCGRQMFFWRIAFWALAFWIARLWWVKMGVSLHRIVGVCGRSDSTCVAFGREV